MVFIEVEFVVHHRESARNTTRCARHDIANEVGTGIEFQWIIYPHIDPIDIFFSSKKQFAVKGNYQRRPVIIIIFGQFNHIRITVVFLAAAV